MIHDIFVLLDISRVIACSQESFGTIVGLAIEGNALISGGITSAQIVPHTCRLECYGPLRTGYGEIRCCKVRIADRYTSTGR